MSTQQAPRTMRLRRALALAGCGVMALCASACESTEQESAKIGRESEAAARAASSVAKQHVTGRSHLHGHRSAHPAHARAAAHS
jgi:hypothetical protein